jgi:putative oxidoreductase
VSLQRLFSTFANGWPGKGLLVQRLLTAIAVVHYGIVHLKQANEFVAIAPQAIAAGAGLFLLFGLWTPVAGTLVAIVELWISFSAADDPWISIMLATLGATLAMIGPGAWSIDARLFGRKHIETPEC